MKSLYPFESHFLDLDGERYHYLDEGSGEVLLMVHGNPTWSFYYRNLVLNLRGRYRVIVPDHIGCGYSDKPQDYNYTLQQHIDNLTTLINTLQLKNITFFMHDWGGPISMGYAVEKSENVKQFIIFNTAAFWFPEIPFSLRILKNSFIGSLVVKHLNLFVWSGILMGSRKFMTRKVKLGYLKPYNSIKNRVAVLEFIRDIPISENHESFPVLKAIEEKLPLLIDHKLLIIWGGKDPIFTKAFLREWRNRFPGASVKVIEDAGHYVVEDGIDQIIPHVENFLKYDMPMDSSRSNIN
jgi:pimeloyl-ACP methyl ester carboxylesterase